MNKVLRINCPQCAIEFLYYESAHRPFCSEKCKMIDLGHWFEESYRVPVKEKDAIDFEDSIEENIDEE